MKRLLSIVLVLALILLTGVAATAKTGSDYFTDIPADAWYAEYIDICYESGLMKGVGNGQFHPDGVLTCAEMIMACARLHNVLNGGDGTIPPLPEEERGPRFTGKWYDDAMWYWENALKDMDLSDDLMELEAYVTETFTEIDLSSYAGAEAECPRACLALMLALVLEGERLPAFNTVEAIPDLDFESVRMLYRAGILGGVDSSGTFSGHSTLRRSELAAVIARAVKPELRLGYAPSSFEFDLLASMPQDENYMISPISLKLALAMAANGAGGATKQELLDVLGISDLEQYNSDVLTFINSCNNNEKVELNVANSIWYNTDYYSGQGLEGEAGRFSEYFTLLINSFYKGTAENITNADGAKRINAWIAAQTNGKITGMMTDEKVQNSLSFLVNAIYFKGNWQNPFKAENTTDRIFTDRSGTEVATAFMHDVGRYSYAETDSLQMLAKPYKDTDIQMYFILPKGDAALTQAMFDEALAGMSSERVYFSLPKFKTEYLHQNLKGIMQDFGIETAFNYPDAEFHSMFEGIRPDMPVRIDDIVQKTFIEVDEKGTEAAAVTIIDMAPGSAIMPDPVEFICDRPFTYIIRADSTGTILFMGEYAFAE